MNKKEEHMWDASTLALNEIDAVMSKHFPGTEWNVEWRSVVGEGESPALESALVCGNKTGRGRVTMGWFYGGGISPRLHSFNDFDSVEIAYETTKPLTGAANKGKDIRPIGERRRKWERIHKFTDNCYGLMDGGTGDPVDGWEEATLGEMLFFCTYPLAQA